MPTTDEISVALPPDITESRVARISGFLEKEPVFAKRLTTRSIPLVGKRSNSGAPTLHYPQAVEIAKLLVDQDINPATATKAQVTEAATVFFHMEGNGDASLPAAAITSTVEKFQAPVEKPTPPPVPKPVSAPAPAPEPVRAPELLIAGVKPVEVKPVEVKPVPVKAKAAPKPVAKPVDEKPEAKPEGKLSLKDTFDFNPILAQYTLVLSAIQLGKLDSSPNAATRMALLEQTAYNFQRALHVK